MQQNDNEGGAGCLVEVEGGSSPLEKEDKTDRQWWWLWKDRERSQKCTAVDEDSWEITSQI